MSGSCNKKLEAQSSEAQRILRVLDNSILKMKLITCLPNQLERPELEALMHGDYAAALLAEHLELSEDQDVRSVQSSLQNFICAIQESEGSGLQVSKESGLQKSCGPGSQDPGLILEEDSGTMWELTERLQSFRDVMLDRLLTTPSEENKLKHRVKEATVRHQSDLELIDKLEKEVAQVNQERDKELRRRDEEILKRRNSLQKIIQETKDNLLKTQMDSFQQKISDEKNSEEKCQRLKIQVDQLQSFLTTLRKQQWESAQTLRMKNKKLETQIDSLIKRYDTDLGEKQEELEKLTIMYEEEQVELKELQELYSTLEPEYTQVLEKRRQEEERRNHEEKELQAKSKAALIIQAMWRGWRVRKNLKNKNKSKNKNKKSKGGKKGK